MNSTLTLGEGGEVPRWAQRTLNRPQPESVLSKLPSYPIKRDFNEHLDLLN